MTKLDMSKCLAIVTIEYPKFEATRERIDLWHELLGRHDAIDVARAIQSHLLSSKWEPRIAEINELLTKPDYPTALEAWGEVRKAIGAVGYLNGRPEFSHPAIDFIVVAMGWQTFCDMTNADVTRSNFMKLYDGQCQRGSERALRPAIESGVTAMGEITKGME